MKLQIISLDVWGNENDGFDINQAFHTGITFEINPAEHENAWETGTAETRAIFLGLRDDAKYLRSNLSIEQVEIQWIGEEPAMWEILDANTSEPICHVEAVEE